MPEVELTLAIAVLEARRAELTGGENSVGVQAQTVEQMQADLDEATAALAACESELAAVEAAIAALSPVPVVPEVEV